MFNFKSFAAVAVAAASIFAQVPAAQAQQFTAGEKALFNALDRAGVTYEAGTCEDTDTYGFYLPSENYIAVCTNVATTHELRWETLRHEAVHAAQKCVNPSMTSMVKSQAYIEYHASQDDWSFIQRAYDPEDYAIELEAFTLMRRSNQYIAAFVNSACN